MTVYKMIDVVGTSRTSVSDAVRGAVHRASRTLDDLQWFEVKEIRGRIMEDEVTEYQVKVEIGFTLHATEEGRGTTGQTHAKGPTPGTRSEMAQVGSMGGERKKSDVSRNFEKQPKPKPRE